MARESRIICICAGRNPQCSKCQGRGYYNTDDLPPARFIRGKKPPKPTQVVVETKCYICKCKVLKKNLELHLKKVHGFF